MCFIIYLYPLLEDYFTKATKPAHRVCFDWIGLKGIPQITPSQIRCIEIQTQLKWRTKFVRILLPYGYVYRRVLVGEQHNRSVVVNVLCWLDPLGRHRTKVIPEHKHGNQGNIRDSGKVSNGTYRGSSTKPSKVARVQLLIDRSLGLKFSGFWSSDGLVVMNHKSGHVEDCAIF